MNRLLRVTRLHTVAWPSLLGLPWLIVGSSFVLNLVIFALIEDQVDGRPTTGGLGSLYVTTFIMAAAAVSQVFPYALGMSVTRRSFYVATSLLVVVQAVAFGIVLYLLKLAEEATAGWGVSMNFFAIPFADVDNAVLQILVYGVPLLFLSLLGMLAGTMHVRWGSNGVFVFILGLIVIVGLLGVLIAWQRWWDELGTWLTDQSPVSLIAGWPMLAVPLLAAGGFLAIRRATA